MGKSYRDQDALRKRNSDLACRVILVHALPEEKLTAEQVQHEYLRITGDYLDAKEVIKTERDNKLDALRERCPHENVDDVGETIQPQTWCNDCESGARNRLGFAIEDSSPIPNHPECLHVVKVMLDPGESLGMHEVIRRG